MISILRREFIYLWYYSSVQFDLIFKYWAFGMIIGSIIAVFGKDKIHKLFESMKDKEFGVLGIFLASALGIASPLCMYGTIPIAASFSKSGMPDDWLGAFMMSSVLLNPQLIIYSAVLGPEAFLIRILVSFLCGIVGGLIIKYAFKSKSYFHFTSFNVRASRDTHPNLIIRLLLNMWRNIKATGPYFLVGIFLTACFQRYVPTDLVVRLFGNNEAFGVLMAATIGVPLYVCGGGTIPLLQQWLMDGMSLGSATAFMVTGPATKITNLGALKIVLGKKHFVYYLAYVMMFSLIAGLLVNVLF